jgi:hypothetical protein
MQTVGTARAECDSDANGDFAGELIDVSLRVLSELDVGLRSHPAIAARAAMAKPSASGSLLATCRGAVTRSTMLLEKSYGHSSFTGCRFATESARI